MWRNVVLKIDKYYHCDIKVGLFSFDIAIVSQTDNLDDVIGKEIVYEVVRNRAYSLKEHINYYASAVVNKLKVKLNLLYTKFHKK